MPRQYDGCLQLSVSEWSLLLNGHFISNTLSPWQVHVTMPSGVAPIQGMSGLMMNPDA